MPPAVRSSRSPAPLLGRLLAALLAVTVLGLRLPLEALAALDGGRAASCCCAGGDERASEGAEALAPRRPARTSGAEAPADQDAPAPADDCDDGCHCACCGGVPLAPARRGAEPAHPTERPAGHPERLDAPGAQASGVFHPPRG